MSNYNQLHEFVMQQQTDNSGQQTPSFQSQSHAQAKSDSEDSAENTTLSTPECQQKRKKYVKYAIIAVVVIAIAIVAYCYWKRRND